MSKIHLTIAQVPLHNLDTIENPDVYALVEFTRTLPYSFGNALMAKVNTSDVKTFDFNDCDNVDVVTIVSLFETADLNVLSNQSFHFDKFVLSSFVIGNRSQSLISAVYAAILKYLQSNKVIDEITTNHLVMNSWLRNLKQWNKNNYHSTNNEKLKYASEFKELYSLLHNQSSYSQSNVGENVGMVNQLAHIFNDEKINEVQVNTLNKGNASDTLNFLRNIQLIQDDSNLYLSQQDNELLHKLLNQMKENIIRGSVNL